MSLPTPETYRYDHCGQQRIMEHYRDVDGFAVTIDQSTATTWSGELALSDEVTAYVERPDRDSALHDILTLLEQVKAGPVRAVKAGPIHTAMNGKVLSTRMDDPAYSLPAIVCAHGTIPDVGPVMLTACDNQWQPGDRYGGDTGDAFALMLRWFPGVVAPPPL